MTLRHSLSTALRRSVSTALLTLAVAACSDEGPVSGPGTLSASIVSPNGAEGAAVVSFFGPGIESVRAASGIVYWDRVADTVRVVVLDSGGGDLGFLVDVADTMRRPEGVVLEVAAPDDQLRATAGGYALEFRR